MKKVIIYKLIDNINHKQCSRCKEFLLPNLENFYYHKAPSDKLTCWCKQCVRDYKNARNQRIAKGKVYKHVIWNDEKLAKLKELFPTMKNKDLAIVFNTTEGAIESVACREKLKKTFKNKK